MGKKLFFMVVVISLFLIGSANAHKQTMHQHITRESFDLLQMSFPGQLSELESSVGKLDVTEKMDQENRFHREFIFTE